MVCPLQTNITDTAAVFENKNWSAGYHKAAFLMVYIFLIHSLLHLLHMTIHISAQQDRDRGKSLPLEKRMCWDGDLKSQQCC